MPPGYERAALADVARNPEKPSDRWELSPALDLAGYNFNVAVLAPGERLSRTAYHRHPDQEEFFYVLEGVCRVEVEDGSFDLGPDEMVVFRPGVVHLLHNPHAEPAKLVAVGAPPEGRHPVEQVQSYESLLAERYPEGVGSAEAIGSGDGGTRAGETPGEGE